MTDRKMLQTIYNMYNNEYKKFENDQSIRTSKIYVPIDCQKVSRKLRVDKDLVFGRLYYHLDKKYGYASQDPVRVHFFALNNGKDKHCVNFPLMHAVLSELKSLDRKHKRVLTISILSLLVSFFALGLKFEDHSNSTNTKPTNDSVTQGSAVNTNKENN